MGARSLVLLGAGLCVLACGARTRLEDLDAGGGIGGAGIGGTGKGGTGTGGIGTGGVGTGGIGTGGVGTGGIGTGGVGTGGIGTGGIGAGGSSGFCGDGVVEPGEACDLGAANGDRPAFEIEFNGKKIAVSPLESPLGVVSYYDYSSASSHTGLEAAGASRILLHREHPNGVLSLVMFHGIDTSASGVPQPQATAQFSIDGLPLATIVSVVDDNINEFGKSSATSAFGNWHFHNNTDGGALSGFPVPGNWQVIVSATFSFAISDFSFVDAGQSFISVAPGGSATLIIRAYDSPAKCRTNCTIPACGDGILDGGEVCDDGNDVGGDGCSADCQSLV